MSVFRTSKADKPRPVDPESLFRDLKDRSAEVRHLWSHQADILRAYADKHQATTDVALELPTGAGKTLVGLLIAEFRRRKLDERVVYLCPTRQLAHQVGAQARRYGTAAHVLVGRQAEYPVTEFAAYQKGEAIAITTYSGLFNVNPRLDDPHVIICDDAHAGESFISSMWSAELVRREHADAFQAVIDLISADLPPAFASRLSRTDLAPHERRNVELLPCNSLRARAEQIRDALDAQIPGNAQVRYPWQTIRDHLDSCQLYVTWDSILIRPFIPPSLTHGPFQLARQRVYMSATLGEGGELERITGIPRIERLPIPAGWDKQGSGRRLFVLPELSLDATASQEFTLGAVQHAGRSLILVPNSSRLDAITQSLTTAGITVLRAQDIEESLDPFLNATNAALVLANRYDGLDLAGDACRMLVLHSLPGDTNLQESFLLSRLRAMALLKDRLLTRLTQAVGRCTRSDTDFAVVILMGSTIVDFVLKTDNRSLLHPELQAELEFGIQNSEERTVEELSELLEAFLSQSADWKSAEAEILKARANATRTRDTASETLARTVADEVNYSYAMWSGRYEDALQQAQSVADAMQSPGLQPYRAWWYYLAAEAALSLFEQTNDAALHETAKDRFRRAGNAAQAVTWFSQLARKRLPGLDTPSPNELLVLAGESVLSFLGRAGHTGRRFEDRLKECADALGRTEHKQFHLGLRLLGEMLGFTSDPPAGNGTPDGLWSLADRLHIAHEAKTEQSPGDAVSIGDVRQAAGHEKWVRANRPCATDGRVVYDMITRRQKIDKGAIAHTGNLCHVTPDEIRALAGDAFAALRTIRAEAGPCDDNQLNEIIRTKFTEAKLTPDDVVRRLTARRAADLPQA